MEIKTSDITEKVITLSFSDMIWLGYYFQTIHKIVQRAKAPGAVINLMDKNIQNILLKELDMLDKFMDKIAIYPEDSNVFD